MPISDPVQPVADEDASTRVEAAGEEAAGEEAAAAVAMQSAYRGKRGRKQPVKEVGPVRYSIGAPQWPNNFRFKTSRQSAAT